MGPTVERAARQCLAPALNCLADKKKPVRYFDGLSQKCQLKSVISIGSPCTTSAVMPSELPAPEGFCHTATIAAVGQRKPNTYRCSAEQPCVAAAVPRFWPLQNISTISIVWRICKCTGTMHRGVESR